MASHIPCVHPHMRWEINPKTRVKTQRCVRCGRTSATIEPLPEEITNVGRE
jgi:hypothetical protein